MNRFNIGPTDDIRQTAEIHSGGTEVPLYGIQGKNLFLSNVLEKSTKV